MSHDPSTPFPIMSIIKEIIASHHKQRIENINKHYNSESITSPIA